MKTKTSKRSEISVAKPVLALMQSKGMKLLREELVVRLPDRRKEQKLDALLEKIEHETGESRLVAVEFKVDLTHELISQATRWLSVAHYVWIAVGHPGRFKSKIHMELLDICASRGIGVLYVTRNGIITGRIIARAPDESPYRRVDDQPLREALVIGAESHGAGQEAGQPAPLGSKGLKIADWLEPVKAYVRESPDATAKEIKLACRLTRDQFNKLLTMSKRGELEKFGFAVRTVSGQYRYHTKEQQ